MFLSVTDTSNSLYTVCSLPIILFNRTFAHWNSVFSVWKNFILLSGTKFSSVARHADSLQYHGLQHTRPPCPPPTAGVYSNSCPLSQWCHPTISSSVIPCSSHFQSFPASGLFKWVSSSHQVAKVLEFQLQHQSFQWIFRTDFLQEGLNGSPCSQRDSQESSSTPQF